MPSISRDDSIRIAGLLLASGYAALIGWLFVSQPQTLAEASGGLAARFGVYQIDQVAFADGHRFFTADRFVEARAAFDRADPAKRDPRTQFYIAYSFYRQGWHRTHSDDALYRQGLASVDRAIALAPGGRLVIDDDPGLAMTSADELRAELGAGLQPTLSDFNPLRLLEPRK